MMSYWGSVGQSNRTHVLQNVSMKTQGLKGECHVKMEGEVDDYITTCQGMSAISRNRKKTRKVPSVEGFLLWDNALIPCTDVAVGLI